MSTCFIIWIYLVSFFRTCFSASTKRWKLPWDWRPRWCVSRDPGWRVPPLFPGCWRAPRLFRQRLANCWSRTLLEKVEIWWNMIWQCDRICFLFFWVYFCLLSLLCFFSVRSLNGECTRLNLEKKTMGSTSMGKTLLHAIDQVKYSTQRESLPLL